MKVELKSSGTYRGHHADIVAASSFRRASTCIAARAAGLAGSVIALAVGVVSMFGVDGAAEAKTPGVTYCFNAICHRVYSLETTAGLVGHEVELETSFYDGCHFDVFNPCGLTSSGEVFRPGAPDNAASPVYPDGTTLLLFNPETRQAVVVRVNNAGPYWGRRKLDVSRAAADKLGFRKRGVARLKVMVLAAPDSAAARYRRRRTYDTVPGPIGEHPTLADAHQALLQLAAYGDDPRPGLRFGALTALGLAHPAEARAVIGPIAPQDAPGEERDGAAAGTTPPSRPVRPDLATPQLAMPQLAMPSAPPPVLASLVAEPQRRPVDGPAATAGLTGVDGAAMTAALRPGLAYPAAVPAAAASLALAGASPADGPTTVASGAPGRIATAAVAPLALSDGDERPAARAPRRAEGAERQQHAIASARLMQVSAAGQAIVQLDAGGRGGATRSPPASASEAALRPGYTFARAPTAAILPHRPIAIAVTRRIEFITADSRLQPVLTAPSLDVSSHLLEVDIGSGRVSQFSARLPRMTLPPVRSGRLQGFAHPIGGDTAPNASAAGGRVLQFARLGLSMRLDRRSGADAPLLEAPPLAETPSGR